MSAQFDDGKEEGALRTIGEVGTALGLKPHVLRYWEQQFPQLDPLKRSGGRRYYRPEDVALVEQIDRLVNQEGYTLKGAQKALSDKAGSRDAHETDSAGTGDSADGNRADAPSANASGDPGDSGGAAAADGATGKPVPPEVVAQLKSIRQRLADALAA